MKITAYRCDVTGCEDPAVVHIRKLTAGEIVEQPRRAQAGDVSLWMSAQNAQNVMNQVRVVGDYDGQHLCAAHVAPFAKELT